MLSPRCPRCGKGKLFSSMLKVNDQCPACALDFAQYNSGDGPTYFTILFVGMLVMVSAGIVEYKFEPPFWLHALLWIPLTFIVSILSLRWFKSLIITVHYEHEKEK